MTAGVRFPMTSKFVVDEQEFLDIVDQLRVAVPEEIEQAKRITLEKNRVIGYAQTEADKILNSAQERAAILLQDNEVVKIAEQQAQSIVAEAEQAAEEIRAGADSYALEVLLGLETELNRVFAQVRKGRATLQKATQDAAALRQAQSSRLATPGRDVREHRGIINDLSSP